MGPSDFALEAAAFITASGTGATGTIAGLTDSQKRRVANDLTATLQEIYELFPALYRARRSVSIRPSATALSSFSPAAGAGQLTVTGGGASQVDGVYIRLGNTAEGYPYYSMAGSVVNQIYYNGNSSQWMLSSVNTSGEVPYWVRSNDGTSPLGQYTGVGSVSGVSLTVAASGPSFSTSYQYLSGSTIFYDSTFNEVDAGNLLIPYGGAYGNRQVTFYDDSFVLGADVASVLGPVVLDGRVRLEKANNRSNFGSAIGYDYGRLTRSRATPLLTTGFPCTYWVEPVLALNGGNHASSLRLRILPLPTGAGYLTFDVTLRAPVFTVADLGTDNIPSTRTIVVANAYHQSIIRPMFLKRWASSPWFRMDRDVARRIDEDDARARAMIREYRAQHESRRNLAPPM